MGSRSKIFGLLIILTQPLCLSGSFWGCGNRWSEISLLLLKEVLQPGMQHDIFVDISAKFTEIHLAASLIVNLI
jgi:hypothetical protein